MLCSGKWAKRFFLYFGIYVRKQDGEMLFGKIYFYEAWTWNPRWNYHGKTYASLDSLLYPFVIRIDTCFAGFRKQASE